MILLKEMMDGIGIDVYIKFGIHKNKAKVVVEFENFSFHPLQQQSSQRTENTGTSN